MQEMIAAIDDKAYLKSCYHHTPYHLQFQGEANIDIERSMNQIRYKHARKKLYYSQKAPVVFAAYAALQKTELANIISIIEGVSYQVDSELISKMLIY